jgi:hypothetical protein
VFSPIHVRYLSDSSPIYARFPSGYICPKKPPEYASDCLQTAKRVPGNPLPESKFNFGYWSFETAAIVKIMGLDDSSFRGCKYYPKIFVCEV